MFNTRLIMLSLSLLSLYSTANICSYRESGTKQNLHKAVSAQISGFSEKSGISFYDKHGKHICGISPFPCKEELNSSRFREWLKENNLELNQLKTLYSTYEVKKIGDTFTFKNMHFFRKLKRKFKSIF